MSQPSWINEVSFDDGDDVVKTSRIDTYKGTIKNATDRIAIALRRKDEEGKYLMDKISFLVVNAHYHPSVGYVICTNGFCCERMGAPKSRIATIIVQYITDRDGNIDKTNFRKYQVWPWVINGDKYNDLKRRNKSNPLHQTDLEVTCKDTQYQKLDIVPAGEALWMKKDEIRDDILAKVKKLEESLPNLLGRKMTTEELKEALGDDVDGVEEGGADSSDYSDLLADL